LLISCELFAVHALNDSNFEPFVKKIELLQDSNPSEAYSYFQSIEKHLPALPTLSITNQIVFYKLQSEVYLEQAQYDFVVKSTSKGLDLAKQLSSPSIVITELLYARGFAIESLGDIEAAQKEYRAGLGIAESLNNNKFIVTGLANLGATYYLTERFDRAFIVLNDALALTKKFDDDETKGFIHAELGILYSYIGQDDKSMEFYQKSYEYYQKAGKNFYAYNSLQNIAINHSYKERYEEAIVIYKEIIENAGKIGNIEVIAGVYMGMAWAQLKKADKDPEAAYQYMLIASQYAEQAQQHDIPLSHAIDKAYLLMEMERYQEALTSSQLAEKYIKKYEPGQYAQTVSKLNLWYLQAEIYYKLSDYKNAFLVQEQYAEFALSLAGRSSFAELDDIRMRYESEQADLKKKILEQKESVQSLLLKDANTEIENRQLLMMFIAIVALFLAWALVKVISGQKLLFKVSNTDSLTGVSNRRQLIELGNKYFVYAKKSQQQLSVLMLDVDDFKSVNDNYGHKIGDRVLMEIASLGQSCMRSTDEFGRVGGEEFMVLLPDTSNAEAQHIADRLRLLIFDHHWKLAPDHNVSVSIGAAHYDEAKHQSFEQLLKSADVLLYQAKHQGKNKVCFE
jgi:diguanylate cyclase (GGDEF)-like protein